MCKSNKLVDSIVRMAICPNCGLQDLELDDSDQNCDRYTCTSCKIDVEVGYDRRPVNVVAITDVEQDIRQELWRE